MDYTAKLFKEREKMDFSDTLDYTPIAIPTGCKVPETSKMTIARIMLQSGVISHDDFHKMIGVEYDGEFGTEGATPETFGDFEQWEDEFKQSEFARYEANATEYDSYNNNDVRLDASNNVPEKVPAGVSVESAQVSSSNNTTQELQTPTDVTEKK